MKAVRYTRIAIKALKAMPAKDRNAIMNKLEAFAAGEPQDVSALKGSAFFRLRHGDWRAVFEQDEQEINVLDVAHRREIYR
ncbi:MAG: type II toxin-antitoxin system RelE family toxin [Rhizomicrobium sp.]